jgi:hypothetical protein
MLVVMTVNKSHLPPNGFGKLETETKKRLAKHYPEAEVSLLQGHNFNLTVSDASKTIKSSVSQLLEEMLEEANDWLYEEEY